MITKLTEIDGCKIVEFVNQKRFTLMISESVKSELKPFLLVPNTKMVLDLKDIEFIDSSGIGCIISLMKTAKNNYSALKICGLSKEIRDVIELLHLQMILDIEEDRESSIKNFSAKNG